MDNKAERRIGNPHSGRSTHSGRHTAGPVLHGNAGSGAKVQGLNAKMIMSVLHPPPACLGTPSTLLKYSGAHVESMYLTPTKRSVWCKSMTCEAAEDRSTDRPTNQLH